MFFTNLLDGELLQPNSSCSGTCYGSCTNSESDMVESCLGLCKDNCYSSCTSVDQRTYEDDDNSGEVCITCLDSCKYGCLSSCQLNCTGSCFNIERIK